MSKQFYFFKKAARNRLEDNTFWTLWELVESWTQNDWLAIFFIIFLGIIFEIILIKICTSFNKKPALTEKGSSSAQEKENNCLKSVKFDNWPIPSSSEERVDDFSERTIASSLTSEENESNFEDRVLLADEVIWLSTSESKYQVSHFSESHITSSNGTSSSLSLFHSEVKEFFPSHGGYPENEHETIQFSSKKLFSTLKTNKNKNLIFSSDFNFSRNSRRSIESEDLNVAPCPPAHLFLSRDQVRILEENVRNQVALKSKTTSKSKTTYLCSRFQESPIQNQHSVTMDISAQAQDSLPGQNAIQNQGFYEARFTSQVQQFVNNQESVNSQPDIMVFALPRDLTRKPFCSSTQESFQTQEKDRSQHLVNVSYSVETQDSIKGLESDKNQFDEAQYSFCFEDSNKSKHLIEGQNAIFKNSRCLVLTVSPNALAEGMLQIESVKPEGQKQITSSELNQYFTYGSGPLSRTLFKRQKNRRKTLHSKSKFSLIVLSQKSKKTQVPLVFQITVCHTSKPSKLGCKYNAKKELHQRKSIPDTALHLTYVSKPVPPYIKKYSRKELVKVMPGVTGCRHSLSLDAENVNDAGSTEKRRTSGRTGDIKQHGRENEGQKTISPKTSPQLEQSFNNIFQLKSPCFSLIEMNWKNKESLKGPITQAKGIGIAEFHAPNSKKTSDLHIPKQEAPLEDIISEPWQKFVSSPKVESNRRMKIQEDLRSTENSHLPLLGGKKLPTSSPETRRYFPDGSTQKQEDFLEIVLETSEVNLFISLGIKEYKDSEQLASIKTQKSTEDVIMKEKKPPVTLHATEGDNPSDSEGLEYNSRSNVKNMQGERIFATFLDATNTNVSEPLDMKMHSRLKAKTDKTTTGSSHSVVKLKKLPDEKKIRDAKYIEKRCIFKKPQERVREEEEQILEEGVPQLPQDFRLSLQLKQKPKYLRFDIKQSSPGSGETQNKEQEVQPQTLPTETVLVTSPCPTMDPFQVEVKQSAERLTGRETTDPENPLTVLENSRVGEVLIETRECGIPFGGSPRKTMDDHIAEEKTDLKRVLSAIALGSFIIHMLPLSYFKRQKIRKKLSGAKRLLSPKSVIRKVKKSTNLLMLSINRHGTASLRKRLRANFKILIKQMLQDKIVADVLVNVTYTHMFILSHSRTHSRLNAENCSQTELKQEKSKDEKEKKYSINKSSYSRYTLEEVKLQDEVRGDEAPPEAVLHDSWNLRMDANPEKELKMEEVPQTITSRESLMESVSYTLDGTQNKGLQCSFKMKMKNPQQNKNRADAFLNVIQSKVCLLPNAKVSSELNAETDMQRITRHDHMQPVQGKLLNGRKVCCLLVSTLSNSVRDKKEEEGKHETLPAPENSQHFIFNAYQNCGFIKSDEELKETQSINIQVQPQTHDKQTILGSTSCPVLDQFQFGNLESYARFSPPKSGEGKIDEIIFSTREYSVPSDSNHQKEQAGGTEKKDTVTFNFCIPALSTLKRKRNFKKYSDTKTLVNLKCGILKAKKPPVSYIFSIKGGVSPNHRKELGCNSTTKMVEVDQSEKMEAKTYSSVTITTPNLNMYSKIEREKGMLGETSLSSKQVKQAIPPNEGKIISDDTKKNSLQDEEKVKKKQETLKVIPQHSQHFKFHSGQRKELDLHQSEGQGSVIEQDISHRMQPTDSMQGEKPKKSHQTQNGAIYTASSKLPLLKSKESLIGEILMDTMMVSVLTVGSHKGKLYSHGKEENAGLKNLQATVLESLDVSTPDLSESKRQRKTFTCRALKNKMNPKCVVMKAKKAPISLIFNISGNGCLKKLCPKILKSQVIDLLIHIKCSGVLEDLIAERKEGLAQELPATVPESLDLSTFALPALKRKRNNLKYIDRDKMSLEWVTSKAKKAPISQTLTISKRGTPSHKKQFKYNLKIMMKQGKPTADMTLNAISSPVPVLLDVKMYNRIKAESDVSWKMRFSHELQQREQSPDGEKACSADSSDNRGLPSSSTKEVKDQHEEAALRNSQHSSFIAGKMKKPHFVKSELEVKNLARENVTEPLNTAQELQQQTLFTKSVLHRVSCSILNSLPLEKLPKRTKTQKGLKYAKSPKILYPVLEKSIRESLIVTTRSDILSERGPRKELASSIPEVKLQKDLQARTLKCFDFSTPASSEFEGQRNAAQIPKSRNGKAQVASVLKTINIPRSGALSHGKEQDFILKNTAKEISQGMPGIFVNIFPLLTPGSPAIKMYKKVKAKKEPLRNKSNILQPQQHEGERLGPYSPKKWSNSGSTSESRWQNEKEREGNGVLFEAGLQFLNNTRRRKDQNILITEQKVQQQMLVSKNKLESTCSPLIPFQIEELSKNIPSQKAIPHRIGQKIPCPKSGNPAFDYFSIDEAECSTVSDGSPARKLDVHTAVSLLPGEEEEDIKTQKIMKHRLIQNISSTKSGNSVLGDPGNKSSRRKMGGHIAKKYRLLQRDLLTMSTMSVLFDSESQEKILKFSGRKNRLGPKRITMKAKKRLCSQMLNITEHDNVCYRKEQDYNLKSTINDMQQNKSIANAFLFPTLVSTDNDTDIEMHSTSKAEMDQPRVKLYSHTSVELGKSPGDGEVWKADSIDTQNRSSNTIKRNVQHKKEEENIQKMLSESVPDYNQHFSFSAYHMKNPGSYQSESELNNSEVRNSWNLSYTAQKMRQEKCFRETILEPVSRHVMNFLQVETVKSHHAQEEIKCMEGVKTPFPKVRKSKTGSIQCGARWDRNPRRKWDSSIFERKAWNQNDLVRTVLKPSNFSSFDSSEPKNQRYTLEFEGNKTIINPKYVTLKAKKQPVLQLLDITRCFTGSHRKTMGCKFQYKMKKRQWFESVSEASLLAEGTEIPPPKLVTDKHSFSATARDTLYNRPLHRNLHGHITKEKAELRENSATTFQGPLDFFMPILSDSESQINTVQLLEEKITLNLKCLTMKERDPVNSQMLKIRGRFTTKRRKKLGSNLKARMQQMSQSKNVADTFPNTGYFTPDTSDIKRQSRLKIGMDRVSRFSGVQPTQMELPVEGLVISQPLNTTGNAALNINEQQEKKIERKREKTVLNVDLKFMYDSMPILSHTKMEESPGTWGIYEESSEKRNTLSKANASSAYACTPMHPKIIKHKAKVKTADVENTLHTSRVTLKAKRPPVSKLFDSVTTRYGTRRNKMELRCYIKAQKEFQQYKTVTDLFLNTIYGSGSVSSQIKQFTEVKGEKDRSGKPMYITPQLELEKSLNKRKISSSGSTDIKSAISRNIKILKQCIREEKENCQTVLQDILPQCRDQLAITQQVKKELDHVKIGVALKREVYPDLASPKREISYTRFNIPRIRTHTDCEFFVAQRVKHKDADIVKHSVSIPWERGVSEKTNVSLISKGHNIYLTELDAFRQRTHKEQELWKRESISRTIRGSIVYPIMEPSHLKMTGKVAEEDMYINKKNISHLLRREDIEETNILQGSKGHKFLCTNLVVQQNMSAVQKGEAKPDDIPESIVDSVSHPNREHLQVTQPVHTKKEDVSIPMRLPVNPWRKEQSKLTDIPLRLNRPKIIFPEKLRVKQPHSSTQDKGDILESISSCILHQFHNEKLKEKVSMERMSSKVLSSVVDKASNEADTLGDPPYINLYNRKRKEHQKESTCKVLPMSVSHSSMDVLQIKLPCVKKILKPPAYHTSNTKGIGLLVEEKEHPECIHQISPKSAPHSLRDVFQSKIPREKKASEVVSIVDYVPSTEKIGPPITGKESKVQTGKGKSGMKLTSLCTSLPSLSHTNMNSRAKVGQDKSGILKSCLLPLTLQVSPNVRKISFAESINRDSLSNIQESEHLPQEKKDGENVVHVKDIMGLQRVTFKGQKTAFKHTLHGNEPQWNNKEQEKMRQKDSDLDIVKNKHYASIPSPPHVEWDPEIKEVLMRGITGFCLPSLTLQELSNAMGICEEPTDDILSSIKKAKYMPQKGRVEVALEEIRHPKIIVLKAKQTPVAQELQLNIKEKEKKLQENKDKQVGMWSESSVSISFPPYSEVDTRVKGEEAMLIKTRSSFLQTKFQESSDTGNIAYRQSINGDASTSIKKSKEYIIQEEEERVKMVQVVPLRKKKSPILQETQLDSKEQEKKIQKMKGESNIFVTNTSTCTPAPFYVQLDTRIKKADYVTEVTRYSLPELSQQKSSDAMKKASKEESTDGDIRSDVQEAKEYALQKEETNVEKSAKRDMMQPKDEDLERKQAVLQDIPLNLKEQVIVDPKGEDQGKMDGGGKGKQEVVLSSNWASESSLTYHELNTSIEGEEDIQGITKSAVSLLQLQKLVDARKIVYTKSAGDDTPNDVRGVQEYEPQREEDRRKTINMKYIMYPQSTKAKALPLPHVLYTSRSCDPQIREVQMSIKEKVRYTQERSELGKILTRPSLSQVKLNKGIEGKEEKRVTGPFLPPSWHRESSNAEKLRYTVPLLDGISNYSKRTKCMTQREEDKANNFEKDIIHPKYIGLKAKKSPLLLILKTKKLQVNMKEQEKVGQEDSKETIVLLSKIHPCVTSTRLKWNAIKDKEGEPGIIRNDAPYIEPQESLPSMEIASTEVPDSYVKKGEQRPQQEERNRVQTEASSRLLRDTDFKAKTSSPPHTCSVTEHGDLNKRKEPQWSMKEEEEEQQRTEDPDVALTKTPPSTPSPSYHRLDTRTKVDKDLLAVTGFSPSQLLCPKSSGAGKIRYADSNKGISSCNVIIKAYQCMPYTKVKDRKKIKYGEGIIFPQIITLPEETSPLPHLPSRKRLPLNIKEQGKGVPKGKSELKETYACLPSSSYLKWDTRTYEREDTLGMTQSCFPPPKIQDPSNSSKKTYTKSFDGYVLKEKGRLKTDTENKMARIHMALKAKELPLSLMLNTKKLQWKIREQERKVQKDKNDTATNLENICTSLFTLPHLKFGSTEGERYMIRITKLPLPQLQSKESPDAVKTTYAETTDTELSNGVKQLKEHTLQEEPKDREKNMDVNSLVDPTDRYLKAKKLPNLLRYNLNDLQWKTKEQEGTAQEVQHKPCGAMLTKTCICRSPLLHFSTNTRDKEKRMPILARSSLSSVSFQESSDSEDMEYIEPIASDILIIPQKGKYHMPQNKEENGVEIVNLMLPKHQEKKMQESEDESDVVVAKSSSPLPSLPRLQLDKEIQVDDEILGPTRSIVQRVSNVGEIVHTEAINDHVMKDSENRKQHEPQEEEQDREKTIDRNMMHTTDISLKSRKSPPSLMLYRTELHLNIVGQEQKKHECPGKPLGTVLRKLYVSKPPAKLTLEKGTQVNEERLRIERPSRLPQIFSAVSDTGKRADTEAICDLREKKQHMSQKEKKHEVKTVDMRIRMDHKEARISSISHIFDTKEFVLNIKELKENMYKGKDVVLTRTFLSAPSAPPLYLDSRSKRDKDISGVTGSSPPQQNFQESSDTQKMSITEVVAGNSEIIVKKSEHSVPQEETVQQWTSNFMISVQRRNEPPRVKSEGDLSQLVLNSQPEDVYLTGFGTIRGKRLEYFFTGQEVQPDKYKTETFTTFLSYPTMDPAKIKNLKKQTEIMDSLNHKMSPKVLVSPPQKISKEIYVTFGPPASTNGFSVSEQGAHQQKTLSKASPGSADSYKFDKPEGDVHDKDKMSKIPSPKVLAPQTKGSLEKMNITGSDTAPIIEEQEIVMKKQVVLQSESGQKTWLDSSFSLKFPLQNERQKTPLEIDVHKQSTVYPRIQILPGIHMDITVFDTIGGEKKQTLPVPEQEECILESLQKSLSSHWTFPLQSGGLEGKNKTDTSTTINLEQKTLEMEEGELKIDRNIAICLGEDKTEMHKHTMVNLEENKKRDTSNTIDMNIPSLKAQKSQINTQMMTHTASSYPIKQKHKKKLEVSGAKQNIQPQKLFQKHVLDSFYAYIPLSLKLEGWKGRLTVTDLKRELSPKYLTMKIPNHPISQILNNTGRGTPSNRKKLEYDFKKPKKTILCSKDASGTFIRNLSISTMSSSQTEEIADFETNLEREKISCLSEFQKKSPNSKKKSSSAVKEGNQNFINTVPPDSQPFLVLDKQQMQKLPSVKSEANLSCETNEKILIPQTKEERVVPGHASSSIIKEPDLLMTEEEEKAPKPILTPTEYPLMSDYPKDNVEIHMENPISMNIFPPGLEESQHGTQPFHIMECTSSPDQGEKSEPIQDTTTQKVQQQKTFLGTVPIPSQVKSNEIKVVAHSTSAESSLPLCEATKNIFESQIKNIIHDKICEDILKKVKDHKPNDWKSLPCAGSPETTSTMIPPKMQSKPILERFTPKENGRLTNHLESKAFEIKLNLIPEMAKHSFQRFDFYLKQSISEDNSWRPYPRHKKVCFLSLEGIDTIELNFKQKYAKDSPPVSSLKTLIVNVSSDSEEIITKLKSTGKLEERGVSSVTSAKQMLLPHVLQNYSVEEKDKLLIHFSMKTLEIRMKAFPRIVRESYAMSNPQNIRKPLSKCIHSGIKVPKRKNRVLLIFEEKSLHQIDLDLQYKYLRFLLGLPVKSIFPKPTALPKHILKLNTVAICENIDYRGENSDDLCIDMELLEQHISFKKESPHENSSLMRKFLEPIQVCASDPDQQGTGQKDTTALSELKSHVTPGKDKQCHVWFQETDADKAFDSKAQESAPSLVDSHSTQLSEDFTGSQTNIESSANMEECSAPEAQESEECLFLEANPYLSQESQNILFELQKGIPLGNLYKMEKSKTVLKPLYREDSGSHHTRGCRKHSSIVTPSYESHKGRKYSSSSKMPSPDWLYHSSLNAVEVPSRSSSIPSGEGKTSWTARYRTSHSLAPLTESNVKLHLAKRQGKSHRHLESKERKKAKSDLCRKNNIHWDCDYSYTQNKEKCTRKKKVCHYESERSSYFPGRLELSKPYQEDISFHFERKQNQPFFYACIPADSLEIIPQTVRWTIPPRTLRKTNFRVPLVAKISSSFDIWTSSKKFLESLLGSFSPVNSN